MSLASNLAALARLLTAAASGIVTGKSPAAGDNSTALINSAWFKAEQAAEATQGTAKVATQAQTVAGTDDATIVTPKKLRAGFAISLGSNGYIAFPSWLGSLVIQWGSYSTSGNSTVATVAFPVSFPSACASVTVSPLSSLSYGCFDTVSTIANSNFAIYGSQGGQAGNVYSSHVGRYIAFGY
ncbi:gp53-like domain-containing protein [Paraburkholderia sp.]|uniref:gp53-like domain-containing protein n=1 Tax=Paraburkholderia sp. TaxID=1926495 RepID=UPI00286F7FDA|nr:hypothetical protein [Paraburkholderia sp.]